MKIRSKADLRDQDFQIPSDMHFYSKEEGIQNMRQELEKAVQVKNYIEKLPEGKMSHVPYHLYIPSQLRMARRRSVKRTKSISLDH